jgi:hypothetical protein
MLAAGACPDVSDFDPRAPKSSDHECPVSLEGELMVSGAQSLAVIFTRGLFGIYGLGHLEVSEAGIEVRWSGAVQVRPKSTAWSEIQLVRMRGNRIAIKPVGQLIPTTAFLFHRRPIREALRRWSPPEKLEL